LAGAPPTALVPLADPAGGIRGGAGGAHARRSRGRGPAGARGGRARHRALGTRDRSARRDRHHHDPRAGPHPRGDGPPRGPRGLRRSDRVLPHRRADDGSGGGEERSGRAGGPRAPRARPGQRERALRSAPPSDAAAHPDPAVGHYPHRHPRPRLRSGPRARRCAARRPALPRGHAGAELGEPSLLHDPPHRRDHPDRGGRTDRHDLVDALVRAHERAVRDVARPRRGRDLPAPSRGLRGAAVGAAPTRAPAALGRGAAHRAHRRRRGAALAHRRLPSSASHDSRSARLRVLPAAGHRRAHLAAVRAGGGLDELLRDRGLALARPGPRPLRSERVAGRRSGGRRAPGRGVAWPRGGGADRRVGGGAADDPEHHRVSRHHDPGGDVGGHHRWAQPGALRARRHHRGRRGALLPGPERLLARGLRAGAPHRGRDLPLRVADDRAGRAGGGDGGAALLGAGGRAARCRRAVSETCQGLRGPSGSARRAGTAC
jgi:hypothetical protein